MHDMNLLPEWTDLRFFLELARAGTLSGAARRLNVEHTTVARRLQRLEKDLKKPLFDRRREGYELTEAGQALMPHAEAMESALVAAAELLGSTPTEAHGVVRVGAPEVFGSRVVAPHIAPLLDAHPDLRIDLLLLPRYANLANREADLGVMLEPPESGRYVVTRLTEVRYYLFATPEYLAKHPPITRREDLLDHAFVDYVHDHLMSSGLDFYTDLGFTPRRRFCCTGMLAQQEAALAGVGLCMLPPFASPASSSAVSPPDRALVPVLPDEVYMQRNFWLVAPADLFKLQRVRVVWDHLRRVAEQNPSLFVR
jgi:DNA-binding transcriptional LysR family regulator